MKKFFTFFAAVLFAGSMMAKEAAHNIYVEDQTGWECISIYAWGDDNSFYGGWPGIQPEIQVIYGDTFKVFPFDVTETRDLNLIFNNCAAGIQTSDFHVTEPRDYYLTVTTYPLEGVKVVEREAPSPKGDPVHYFYHPWGGDKWTWEQGNDTTLLGIDGSYLVAEWGDNGFYFNDKTDYDGAEWFEKDLIGTMNLEGSVGVGYPAVGTKVTFVCLHDNYEAVIGGGRAWIIYDTKTAIESTKVDTKAAKIIENGQVIILREGKKFNLVGAELK